MEWLPGEREPSEGDFLPDVPAERGIKVAFYIQELVQHFICNRAKPICFETVINKREILSPSLLLQGQTY